MSEGGVAKYRQAREVIWRWFTSDHIERIDLDLITDEFYDQLETGYESIMEALCSVVGHYVMDDQCGRPEHRYCLYCKTLCENAEVSHD